MKLYNSRKSMYPSEIESEDDISDTAQSSAEDAVSDDAAQSSAKDATSEEVQLGRGKRIKRPPSYLKDYEC